MNATETYNCLRDLQVTPTTPHITEAQVAELLKEKYIKRKGKDGDICLTQRGVHKKTGEI